MLNMFKAYYYFSFKITVCDTELNFLIFCFYSTVNESTDLKLLILLPRKQDFPRSGGNKFTSYSAARRMWSAEGQEWRRSTKLELIFKLSHELSLTPLTFFSSKSRIVLFFTTILTFKKDCKRSTNSDVTSNSQISFIVFKIFNIKLLLF